MLDVHVLGRLLEVRCNLSFCFASLFRPRVTAVLDWAIPIGTITIRSSVWGYQWQIITTRSVIDQPRRPHTGVAGAEARARQTAASGQADQAAQVQQEFHVPTQ